MDPDELKRLLRMLAFEGKKLGRVTPAAWKLLGQTVRHPLSAARQAVSGAYGTGMTMARGFPETAAEIADVVHAPKTAESLRDLSAALEEAQQQVQSEAGAPERGSDVLGYMAGSMAPYVASGPAVGLTAALAAAGDEDMSMLALREHLPEGTIRDLAEKAAESPTGRAAVEAFLLSLPAAAAKGLKNAPKVLPKAATTVSGESGATIPIAVQSLAGGSAGAATGAAVAPEGHKKEGALAGAAVGLGLPLVLERLRRPQVPEVRGSTGKRIPQDVLDASVEEAQRTAGRYAGEVDVNDFANLQSFVADPDGRRVLEREIENVVRTENIAPKTVESQRGVRASARAISRQIGLEPDALQVPKRGARGRAELVAMKDVVSRNVDMVAKIEREMVYGKEVEGVGRLPLTPQEMQQRRTLHGAIQGQTDNILGRYIRERTEAGRNLAAHKILANQTKDPTTWLARATIAQGGVTPDEVLQARIVSLLEDGKLDEVAALVSDLQTSPISEQLTALWKAGLLSAPTTHQVNIVSTAGHLALEAVKDPAASVVDRMFTGALRLTARVGSRLRGHTVPEIARTKSAGTSLRTLGRGARRGTEDFSLAMRGKSTSLEAARRWDYRTTKIDFVPDWLGGKAANPVLDGYQKFVFRFLGAQDKFFKGVRAEQSILDQARVVAINEGTANVSKRAGEIYEGWRANGYVNLPDEVAMQSIADAELATFNNRGHLARVASALKSKARQSAAEGSLAGNLVHLVSESMMPFTGTPSNVVSRAIEYSGGGILNGLWDYSRLAHSAYLGEPLNRALQRHAAETFARGLTGGGLLALGAYLYKDGRMTLNYPQSGGERGLWEVEGKQEFSLFLDNRDGHVSVLPQDARWHSLERISPIGNLLAVGGYIARAEERRRAGPRPENAWADALDIAMSTGPEAGFGLASMVMSQSFLQGTQRFLDAVTQGAQSESGRVNFWETQARSLVPNMIRRVAQAMDTDANGRVVVRATDSWKDAIQAAIPVLREDLPVARDALGEAVTRKSAAGEFLDITYSKLSKKELDDVRGELARLGAPITRRRRERSRGETAQAFSVRAGVEGRDLYEALSALIQSDAYRLGVIDQARQQARLPSEVREISDALRKELIAETIRNTRSRQTRERRVREAAVP